MATVQVNLSSINSEIEAGIIVGIDAIFPDESKLPILADGKSPALIEIVKSNIAT